MAVPTLVAVRSAVFTALGRQLHLDPEVIGTRSADGLEALGLDSHGLLRVLLDTERVLGLSRGLEVADEALETPASLVAGVFAVLAAG